MATPPLSAPETAPPSVAAFCDTDRQLRSWLQLHGWQRSVAWAVQPPSTADTTSASLFQRHVLGASARPVVQEARWDRPEAGPLTWATVPGTLLFPTGSTKKAAWASLLHSPARLTPIPVDSSTYHDWYERLSPKGADEQLVHVERLDKALPLARIEHTPPSSPPVDSGRVPPDSTVRSVPDSAWALQWPGFTRTSDIGAWIDRGRLGSPPANTDTFSLFSADGLRITNGNAPTILGAPPITVTQPGLAVVGRSAWARHQAAVLRNRVRTSDTLAIARWTTNDTSAWAADLVNQSRDVLQSISEQGPNSKNAARYIQNWDFHYDPQSIGALLFDSWMQAYRDEIDRLPSSRARRPYFAQYRQERAFYRMLDTLTARHGPDAKGWRWETQVSDRRFFPVWSADSLVDAKLHDLSSTRYAPLNRTGRGHPSSLAGGPSLVDPLPLGPAPDTWNGWMVPGEPMTVRRHRYEPDRYFARFHLRSKRPAPKTITGKPTSPQTLLVPAHK